MSRRLLAVTVLCVWSPALGQVDIEGELAVEMRVKDESIETIANVLFGKSSEELSDKPISHTAFKAAKTKDKSSEGKSSNKHRHRGAAHESDTMTAAPPFECVYQYPEARQIDAMLSNMMNQLTKVFVRVHHYMTSRDVRRHGGKRFRKIPAKTTYFFDNIYANMTEEYRRFVNETRARVALEDDDPCEHQEEIRDVWRALLDSSQSSLQRAALRCVEEYLRVQPRTAGPYTRARTYQMLRAELSRVRADQLALLCDNFQLCYNELL